MSVSDGIDMTRPYVIAGAQSADLTAQTAGLLRKPGVSSETTGATKVWLGLITGEPNFRGPRHHHGEAETASYVLSGRCRVYFGEDFTEYVEVGAGEFLFVPAHIVHIEANPYDEPVLAVTARAPDNIVVNLE